MYLSFNPQFSKVPSKEGEIFKLFCLIEFAELSFNFHTFCYLMIDFLFKILSNEGCVWLICNHGGMAYISYKDP